MLALQLAHSVQLSCLEVCVLIFVTAQSVHKVQSLAIEVCCLNPVVEQLLQAVQLSDLESCCPNDTEQRSHSVQLACVGAWFLSAIQSAHLEQSSFLQL